MADNNTTGLPPKSDAGSSDQALPPDQQGGTTNRARWLFENFFSLIVALLIVFMIRSSIVEAFKIPSGSMIPTLHIGDHIFVNKFAYGLKIPFSDLLTDHPIFMVKRDIPNRGDIVVFLYPKDESLYYIKRVIGTPGDTVEMKNKTLIINGKTMGHDPVPPAEAEKTLASLDDPRYSPKNIDVYTEHLESSATDHHVVEHKIMIDRNGYMSENFGPITVPADSLFMMGDNRDFSNDSRYWGFVPMKNVKGKAMIIWLTLSLDFKESHYDFEPGRIGTILN